MNMQQDKFAAKKGSNLMVQKKKRTGQEKKEHKNISILEGKNITPGGHPLDVDDGFPVNKEQKVRYINCLR